MCQGLTTEDEVEVAADEGFDCSLCKTHGRGSYGTEPALFRSWCWLRVFLRTVLFVRFCFVLMFISLQQGNCGLCYSGVGQF